MFFYPGVYKILIKLILIYYYIILFKHEIDINSILYTDKYQIIIYKIMFESKEINKNEFLKEKK